MSLALGVSLGACAGFFGGVVTSCLWLSWKWWRSFHRCCSLFLPFLGRITTLCGIVADGVDFSARVVRR